MIYFSVKTIVFLLLFVTIGSSSSLADSTGDSVGAGGVPVITKTPGQVTSNPNSIFDRSASGWTSTGWGSGGSGGVGGFGGYRLGIGRGFVGVSGPDGSISVGKGWVGVGTGAGGGLGFGGYNEQINAAACTILGIPMGSFGALVMSFAGIISIVAGAMGAYKMALSTIVVGAGSWILMPIVSLFFPVACGF